MPWNSDLSTAVHNESGQVALCYYQTRELVVMTSEEEVGYKFTVHANICLAWVNSEHAQAILNKKGGCCGKKQPIFRVASQRDVERWSQR